LACLSPFVNSREDFTFLVKKLPHPENGEKIKVRKSWLRTFADVDVTIDMSIQLTSDTLKFWKSFVHDPIKLFLGHRGLGIGVSYLHRENLLKRLNKSISTEVDYFPNFGFLSFR
jgi:hypothetical protein